jgi:NhaP-type Na+/H+ or K+/H+ antiporter
VFKRLHLDKEPPMETLLVLLFAYSSYCVAEVCELSGIMSIFFCGILLSHYNWYNISEAGKVGTVQVFKALKIGSENLIFAFLGITLALRYTPTS